MFAFGLYIPKYIHTGKQAHSEEEKKHVAMSHYTLISDSSTVFSFSQHTDTHRAHLSVEIVQINFSQANKLQIKSEFELIF